MSMSTFWKAQIMSAAADPTGDKMQAMATRLESCHRAMEFLDNKKYKIEGRQIDVIVAEQVPNACGRE